MGEVINTPQPYSLDAHINVIERLDIPTETVFYFDPTNMLEHEKFTNAILETSDEVAATIKRVGALGETLSEKDAEDVEPENVKAEDFATLSKKFENTTTLARASLIENDVVRAKLKALEAVSFYEDEDGTIPANMIEFVTPKGVLTGVTLPRIDIVYEAVSNAYADKRGESREIYKLKKENREQRRANARKKK